MVASKQLWLYHQKGHECDIKMVVLVASKHPWLWHQNTYDWYPNSYGCGVMAVASTGWIQAFRVPMTPGRR